MERHARDGRGDLVPDEVPQRDEDLLAERDHVVLLDEAHLDVELRELGLAVRAEVLVAVAAGDLVVALHARDHEQLLEELRGLRQRVPGAGGQACGNQEVARALRGRARQGRGLDLDEVLRVEHAACSLVGLGAQAQGVGRGGAAQIEVAVLEARLLADDLGALEGRGDLERQRCGLVEHDDVAHHDLDLTRGEVLVLVALGAPGDDTGDLEHELGAQRVRDRLVTDDDLGDARGVAQVDEGHSTVIAATIDPPGEGDGLTDLLGPQGAGCVGAEHGVSPSGTCRGAQWRPGMGVGSAQTTHSDESSL